MANSEQRTALNGFSTLHQHTWSVIAKYKCYKSGEYTSQVCNEVVHSVGQVVEGAVVVDDVVFLAHP